MNRPGDLLSENRASSLLLALTAAAGAFFTARHLGVRPSSGSPLPPTAWLTLVLTLCFGTVLFFLLAIAAGRLASRHAVSRRFIFTQLVLTLTPALLLPLDLIQEKYTLRDLSVILPVLAVAGFLYLQAVFQYKLRHSSRPAPAPPPGLLPTEWKLRRRTLLTVFMASWLVYSLILLSGIFPAMPFTGDEPHYLLTTKSMVRDHDIDLYNNYLHRDYWEFYPGVIAWHAVPGKWGPTHLYSKHFPALSLVLVPAYWCGDWLGANLALPGLNQPGERNIRVLLARETMTLFTALLVTLFFLLAWEFSGSRRSAWLSWLFFAFCQPVLSYSGLLYPEIPVALILLLVMRQALSQKPDSDKTMLWSGTGIALLPWFGVKFAVPAVIMFAIFVYLKRRTWLKTKWHLVFFLLPIAASTALFLAFLWRLYGVLSPFAVYFGTAAAAASESHFLHIVPARFASSLLAQFLDQRTGLFICSPLYVLFIPGIFIAFRRKPRASGAMLALAASYWLLCASQSFMGGFVPPGRPLLPVAAFLALFAAASLAGAKNRSAPLLFRILAVASVLMALLAVAQPRLFYNEGLSSDSWNKDTQAYLLVRISNIAVDFTRVVPNLVYRPDFSWPVLLAWLAAVAAISLAVSKKEKNGARPPVRLGGHASSVLIICAFLAAHHFFDVRLDGQKRLAVPGGAVFFQDRNSFGPELGGFWIRGKSHCDVVLSTARPCQRLTLDLSSPVPIRAAVICASKGAGERFSLSGPTSARVVIPAPRGMPWEGNFLYLIRFEVASGFYPGKLEPGNPDPRFLGLFVRWPTQ